MRLTTREFWGLVLGALAIVGAVTFTVVDGYVERRREQLETDCETICRARESACRGVTTIGVVCHDGTLHRWCP